MDVIKYCSARFLKCCLSVFTPFLNCSATYWFIILECRIVNNSFALLLCCAIYSPASCQSSSSSSSCIRIDRYNSPVSSVVVMATRTCQPILRHRRSSQLAAVAWWFCSPTGWHTHCIHALLYHAVTVLSTYHLKQYSIIIVNVNVNTVILLCRFTF